MDEANKDNQGQDDLNKQPLLNEKANNDGSHAPTNDLTTEQLFELIRQQGEQIKVLTATYGNGTEVKVVATEKKPEIPKDGVKHKKKTYDFTMPVFVLPAVHDDKDSEKNFVGGRFTAEEATVTPKILDAILAIKGQGILIERV